MLKNQIVIWKSVCGDLCEREIPAEQENIDEVGDARICAWQVLKVLGERQERVEAAIPTD